MRLFKVIAFTATLALVLANANIAEGATSGSVNQPASNSVPLSTLIATPGSVLTLEQALNLNTLPDVNVSFISTDLVLGGVIYKVNLGNAVLDNKSEAIQEFLSDLESVKGELGSSKNLAGINEVLVLESNISQTTIPVSEIVVSGELPIPIATSNYVTNQFVQQPLEESQDSGVRAAASCGNWTPNFINSLSGPHPVSGRTERITFSWSTAALTALKCTGSTAFEPDFVTYNYDGLSYLGDTFISSTSNFPSSYLDTRFLDNPQEHVYTLGNSDNSKLVANFTYSNYVHTNNGNSAIDTAKIVWQRSHYFGACLPSAIAYCIYADASSIILAWLIPMPGSY